MFRDVGLCSFLNRNPRVNLKKMRNLQSRIKRKRHRHRQRKHPPILLLLLLHSLRYPLLEILHLIATNTCEYKKEFFQSARVVGQIRTSIERNGCTFKGLDSYLNITDTLQTRLDLLKIYARNLNTTATFKTVVMDDSMTVENLTVTALQRFNIEDKDPQKYVISILRGNGVLYPWSLLIRDSTSNFG